MYLLLSFYTSLLYTGLVTTFIDIHCTYTFIYMMMYVVLHLSLHVLFFFLSLYTCFFMYAILIFVSHMMPWWVLFKCFRKIGCENPSWHELSSCKVSQEFVLGLDLFCNITSDYEFSDLRLLSWLFVLLWFCHELPNREIVKDIIDVIG